MNLFHSDDRVERRVHVEPNSGCWFFDVTPNAGGYCTVALDGRRIYVHRLMFEEHKGPIPAGLQIDHLCRNRACCNPDHLEAVTAAENIRRGESAERTREHRRHQTHCCRGHAFTAENTRIYRGRRHCRACHRKHIRKQREKRKALAC